MLMADVEKSVVAICLMYPSNETINGTGFIVGEKGLVITADHVVVDAATQVAIPTLFCLRYNETSTEIYQLEFVKRYRDNLAGRDIAALRIVRPDPSLSFPHLEIGEVCETGEAILIAGFPLVFDKPLLPPFFRRGSIASNRYTSEGHNILVLDMGGVLGFSGSPIIQVDTSKVVGVMKGNSQSNPHSGFSVATVILPGDIAGLE